MGIQHHPSQRRAITVNEVVIPGSQHTRWAFDGKRVVTLPAFEDCHTSHEQELLLPATTEKARTERLNVRAGAPASRTFVSQFRSWLLAVPPVCSFSAESSRLRFSHTGIISSGCCVSPGPGATRGRTWLRLFESGSTASMAPRAVGS